MLGQMFNIALLIAALVITVRRNAVWAFTTLYLPAVILFSNTKKIMLPGIPDIDALYGVMYGILAGVIAKGGEPLNFRFGVGDAIMVALSIGAVISASVTEKIWTGVNMIGLEFLGFLMPYFLARAMFLDPIARRRALWTLVTIIIALGFIALIEVRLWPFWVSRHLKPLGLFVGQNTMVMMRFHFFRTQLTFHHPIDTGNACLLIAALIAVLAMTTSVGLKNNWVRLGIFTSLCVSFTSLSYSSWFGALAAMGMLAVLLTMPIFGRVLPLFFVVLLAGGIFMSLRLENMVLGERENIGQTIADSTHIRAKIMQNCWPFAASAGAFGYGQTLDKTDVGLESVDNSYMLYIMRRGYVGFCLLLAIPLVLTWRATGVYARYVGSSQRLPVAVAVTALLGIMVAMFTVWFGFVYASLWVILLGITHSMLDVLLVGPAASATEAAQPRMRRTVISRQLAGA